jgi:uncharacterized protein (UPF0297 family)
MKSKSGEPYHVVRRTRNKRSGGQLSGYAIDITIRVNGEGAYFLQDHNSSRNVMPHNDREELVDTLVTELKRHHDEHFAQ